MARQSSANVVLNSAATGRCRTSHGLIRPDGTLEPDVVHLTMRLTYLGDSSLFIRIEHELDGDQFLPMRATDTRLDAAMRHQHATTWAALPSHCREQYASLPQARLAAELTSGRRDGEVSAAAVIILVASLRMYMSAIAPTLT